MYAEMAPVATWRRRNWIRTFSRAPARHVLMPAAKRVGAPETRFPSCRSTGTTGRGETAGYGATEAILSSEQEHDDFPTVSSCGILQTARATVLALWPGAARGI